MVIVRDGRKVIPVGKCEMGQVLKSSEFGGYEGLRFKHRYPLDACVISHIRSRKEVIRSSKLNVEDTYSADVAVTQIRIHILGDNS